MDRARIISPGPSTSTSPRQRNTAVPASRSQSKKTRLRAFLTERSLSAVNEREWREILAQLAPVSESYIRHLLTDFGIKIEAPFGGVRQRTFEELADSLVEMERAYSQAVERGDRERAQYSRNLVIQAKDHARLAAHNSKASPEKRVQKEEMVEWMLVWLENPGIFPAWVKLRKKNM